MMDTPSDAPKIGSPGWIAASVPRQPSPWKRPASHRLSEEARAPLAGLAGHASRACTGGRAKSTDAHSIRGDIMWQFSLSARVADRLRSGMPDAVRPFGDGASASVPPGAPASASSAAAPVGFALETERASASLASKSVGSVPSVTIVPPAIERTPVTVDRAARAREPLATFTSAACGVTTPPAMPSSPPRMQRTSMSDISTIPAEPASSPLLATVRRKVEELEESIASCATTSTTGPGQPCIDWEALAKAHNFGASKDGLRLDGLAGRPVAQQTVDAWYSIRPAAEVVTAGTLELSASSGHRYAEELRRDLSQLDARLREALSAANTKVSLLETRLQQLEHRFCQDVGAQRELQLEMQRSFSLSQAAHSPPRTAESDDAAVRDVRAMVEQRLQDMSSKIDQVIEDGREVRVNVASQEEQLKMLRALVEARDTHVRMLGEKVGNGDWIGKLEVMRQTIAEEGKERVLQHERLELLERRLAMQEQAQEEIPDLHQHLLLQEQQQPFSLEALSDPRLHSGHYTAASSPWSNSFDPSPRESTQVALPQAPRPPSDGRMRVR